MSLSRICPCLGIVLAGIYPVLDMSCLGFVCLGFVCLGFVCLGFVLSRIGLSRIVLVPSKTNLVRRRETQPSGTDKNPTLWEREIPSLVRRRATQPCETERNPTSRCGTEREAQRRVVGRRETQHCETEQYPTLWDGENPNLVRRRETQPCETERTPTLWDGEKPNLVACRTERKPHTVNNSAYTRCGQLCSMQTNYPDNEHIILRSFCLRSVNARTHSNLSRQKPIVRI